MKIRQIEAFQAVMQSRSMTLAGKILFITQPAVSRLIIELEEEVAFKLFERKKSGLLSTVEGLLLYVGSTVGSNNISNNQFYSLSWNKLILHHKYGGGGRI